MFSKKKFQVLLADDDADDRELFSDAISEIDPSIILTMVGDGEKLMKQLREFADFPDIIFLDLNMPRKNGKECLLEIQHDESLQNIPIIIYSTSINNKDIHESWTKGVMGFMRKPDSYTQLKESIKKIINHDFEMWERNKQDKILINLINGYE